MNKRVAYFNSEAQEFLGLVADRLDNETVSRLNSRELILEDGVETIVKEVTGMAGVQPLIESTTLQKRGSITLHNAKLPALRHMVLTGIGFGVGSHATEVDSAKIGYARTKTGVDNALLRATLVIKQDGNTLVRRPVADLLADATKEGVGENIYRLDNWRLIKADREIVIELEFPEGQAVATAAKHHVEVKFYGPQTRVR